MKCEKMPPGGQRTIGRHVVILLCAACTGCIPTSVALKLALTSLCLGAACTGCIWAATALSTRSRAFASALPARGASKLLQSGAMSQQLCLGAACTGCIADRVAHLRAGLALPRRCLHGVHRKFNFSTKIRVCFASALPARGASCVEIIGGDAHGTLPRRCLHGVHQFAATLPPEGVPLCLGAACTGCIGKSRQIAAHHFVAYAVSR